MKTIKSSTPAAPGTLFCVASYRADRGPGCERRWIEHVSDNQIIHTIDASRRNPTRRSAAMKRLWDCREWDASRGARGDGTTYRLVRIPPPRPRRSVLDRTTLSAISGILCDAGDVPVDPLPDGVRTLVRQRDENTDLAQRWRELCHTLTGDERSTVLGVKILINRRINEAVDERKSVEERIAEAVKAARDVERATWDAERARLIKLRESEIKSALEAANRHYVDCKEEHLLGLDGQIAEAVKAAVRERTEMILAAYEKNIGIRPTTDVTPEAYPFTWWLRDLRDGKGAT